MNNEKVKRYVELMGEIEEMNVAYPLEAMEGTRVFYAERHKGDNHDIPGETESRTAL